MQFSNDNSTWSTAETYSTNKTWTLSTGDGTKTVYVKFKDNVWNWTTTTISDSIILDTTPLTVSSTSPSNSATSVAINTSVTATFSENMDASTITTSTFTISNGDSVSGTVTYSDTTATFTPSENLSYNTTYTATITTGVKDSAGNAMTSDYSWSFTTLPLTP
ncbi:MAG: Ig-like domain-containing protein, partial [Nanoarchaeota archaeon]